MTHTLAEREIARLPWSTFRASGGLAKSVPDALLELLRAQTPHEAEAAYWKLENTVVVQGQLFEVAEHVVPVLIAALAEPHPRHVNISVLELLYQIVAGEAHVDERQNGNFDLGYKCRERARQGLWLLYRDLFDGGHQEAALIVLEVIEQDTVRRQQFIQDAGVEHSAFRLSYDSTDESS